MNDFFAENLGLICYGSLVVSAAIVLVVVPLWLGRKARAAGLPTVSFGGRVVACFIAAVLGAIVVVASLGLFRAAAESYGLAVSIPFLAIEVVLASLVCAWILKRMTQAAQMRERSMFLPSAVMVVSILGGFAVLLKTLSMAQILSAEAGTGANLTTIRTALQAYRQEFGDYPDDLRRLVETGRADREALIVLGKRVDWEKVHASKMRPYTGPVQFEYRPQVIGASERLICVWYDTGDLELKRGCVMFNDLGAPFFLRAAELRAEIRRTLDWCARNAAASRPVPTHPSSRG